MDESRIQFDRYFDAYADAIFRHLYYRFQNRDLALDLTQDVFAGLWKQLCTGTAIDNVRAYLYRSAHNAFVNEIARRKEVRSLEALTDAGFDLPDDGADVEGKAVQQEMVQTLRALDEPYRTALVLRYIDGFRVKEIAELLGEAENTVSVRIKRGLQTLKQQYGPI